MDCPVCSKQYSALGQHFSRGSCSYPELSNYQEELVSGCLLGDGQIFSGREGCNSSFRISSTRPLFLNWLYQEMGYLSSALEIQYTKEELDKQQGGENKQVWRYRTMSHPCLNQFEEWYSSSEKRLPDSFSLTPLKAKMWYCGDGSLQLNKKGYGAARIYSNNEKLMDTLIRKLSKKGFSPSLVERNYGSDFCEANYLYFTTKETEEFLNWMGEAPPGFEYKWEYRKNI